MVLVKVVPASAPVSALTVWAPTPSKVAASAKVTPTPLTLPPMAAVEFRATLPLAVTSEPATKASVTIRLPFCASGRR